MQMTAVLTKLHDESASDIHITESIRPQQAAGAGLQEVSLVVRQVFYKCRKPFDHEQLFLYGDPFKLNVCFFFFR